MPYRNSLSKNLVVLATAILLFSGCLHEDERVRISPASDFGDRTDLGLGPGVRSLSSGPGEKSSPSWSPSGDRIAFTIDGYVVEKRLGDRDSQRRTTRDFDIESVAWVASGDSLSILGKNRASSSRTSDTLELYRTIPETGSLDVTRTAREVQAIAPRPDGDGVLIAQKSGAANSRLAYVGASGEVGPYFAEIPGEVTRLSFAPTGDEIALAARNTGRGGTFELRTSYLSGDGSLVLANLEMGLEVLGAPQIASDGVVYFVAGERSQEGELEASSYRLYSIEPGADEPELVSGVGNDFVASSLKRDPAGERLAVVGRRNTSSPTNLYVFDVASGDFEAATSNQDMEIRTGPGNLDWSADGDTVAIVARTASSQLQIYSKPADDLVSDFYNLYAVPIGDTAGGDAP